MTVQRELAFERCPGVIASVVKTQRQHAPDADPSRLLRWLDRLTATVALRAVADCDLGAIVSGRRQLTGARPLNCPLETALLGHTFASATKGVRSHSSIAVEPEMY